MDQESADLAWDGRRTLDVNLRSGPQMREYELIADRVAAEQVGPVLDWGCGFGQISGLMLSRGVEVESFEWVEGEPVQQREMRTPGVTATVSGEPVALPYPDDHFAAVLSCGVLEHVHSPEDSLDEIHRILRPSGRLFIFKLPNRRSYLEALARRAGLYYHGALPRDTLYDLPGTRTLLTRHSYRVDELRMANMLPLTVTHSLAARFAKQIWATNRALARVPGVNAYSTNVEAIATTV